MPYISVTNPASTYDLLAPQIVTTTIYPSQTASATAGSHAHRQDVPIGAIVGGVCAGAAVACIVTAAWVLWGRSIKRKQLKERAQAAQEQQLSENTKRNAGRFSSPAAVAGSYRPLFGLPESRKIKFAPLADEKAVEKAHSPPRPPTPPPPPLSPRASSEAHESPFDDAHDTNDTGALLPPRAPHTPRTYTPPPLRSTKASRDLASAAKEAPRHSLRSKASAASSASMYSTASGEAHRTSRLFSLPAWDHAFLHPRWSGASFATNMLPKRERTASNPRSLPEPEPSPTNIGIAR
ncbi:hypothetical protein HDZ31DRAFT_65193 [Schizophyllum fasciatum]